MLLRHWERRAASRADWTAGSSRAISTAMIAMTTSSSIRVKPRRRNRVIVCLPIEKSGKKTGTTTLQTGTTRHQGDENSNRQVAAPAIGRLEDQDWHAPRLIDGS